MESVLAFRFGSPGFLCNNVYILFRIDIHSSVSSEVRCFYSTKVEYSHSSQVDSSHLP